MIKELIVVEGKDDISAVKKAVKAQVIATSGLGIEEKTLKIIEMAVHKTGVIILTDPDYAGEKIRRIINDRIPGCKNAFLPREAGTKDGNIGIENASPADILKALEDVKVTVEYTETHSAETLRDLGILSGKNAKILREKLGEYLGIGYCNGKQFHYRLNSYGVTKDEFTYAFKKIKTEAGIDG
ncbi:MAG: ribonuclease M5 [Eubacteriaceae bacterium]|nr:ribonuclease M5 [Eubacteriaceae bacterium]